MSTDAATIAAQMRAAEQARQAAEAARLAAEAHARVIADQLRSLNGGVSR